jgi:hypothetical protein
MLKIKFGYEYRKYSFVKFFYERMKEKLFKILCAERIKIEIKNSNI